MLCSLKWVLTEWSRLARYCIFVASLMLLLGVKLLCISLLSSATCSGDNTEERKVVSGNFSSCSTVMFMYWSSPISSFSGLSVSASQPHPRYRCRSSKFRSTTVNHICVVGGSVRLRTQSASKPNLLCHSRRPQLREWVCSASATEAQSAKRVFADEQQTDQGCS